MYVCDKCGRKNESFARCPCGGVMQPTCAMVGCDNAAMHEYYAFGYVTVVCQEHYDAKQAQLAVKFKYAER